MLAFRRVTTTKLTSGYYILAVCMELLILCGITLLVFSVSSATVQVAPSSIIIHYKSTIVIMCSNWPVHHIVECHLPCEMIRGRLDFVLWTRVSAVCYNMLSLALFTSNSAVLNVVYMWLCKHRQLAVFTSSKDSPVLNIIFNIATSHIVAGTENGWFAWKFDDKFLEGHQSSKRYVCW